jgi:MFS family permease
MSERRQQRGVVLAIILAGYLLVLIDVSILMAALPSIRADLRFSDTSLSWAQNAYTLTFGGLLLLGARAGDLLGRRRTFMLGIGVFTAASLAVGLAQSPAWMIAARAVQGIGAATLAPSTLALLSTSFPEGEQRARAMAAYGALAGIGTAAGLIIGGALTETLSWRYGFLLNVPIGLAAIVAPPATWTRPSVTPAGSTSREPSARPSEPRRWCSASCTPPTPAGATTPPSSRWRSARCSSRSSSSARGAPPDHSCRCACSPIAAARAPTPPAFCSTACWSASTSS